MENMYYTEDNFGVVFFRGTQKSKIAVRTEGV